MKATITNGLGKVERDIYITKKQAKKLTYLGSKDGAKVFMTKEHYDTIQQVVKRKEYYHDLKQFFKEFKKWRKENKQ